MVGPTTQEKSSSKGAAVAEKAFAGRPPAFDKPETQSDKIARLKSVIAQTRNSMEKESAAKQLGSMILELTDAGALRCIAIYHPEKIFRFAALEKLAGNAGTLKKVAEACADNDTIFFAIALLAKIVGNGISTEELRQIAYLGLIVSPGASNLDKVKKQLE